MHMCLHIFRCRLAHVSVLKYARHPQTYLSVIKFEQEPSKLLLAHWCISRCMRLVPHLVNMFQDGELYRNLCGYIQMYVDVNQRVPLHSHVPACV